MPCKTSAVSISVKPKFAGVNTNAVSSVAVTIVSAAVGASFTAATTAYTSSNEVSNSGSYSAGGGTLTNVTPTTSGTTALTDFADLAFTSATITARGALIYNDSAAGDPTVAVLDFGADKTSTTGTFTIQFPTADATNAIIRIA